MSYWINQSYSQLLIGSENFAYFYVYGKPRIDEASDAWNDFIHMNRNPEENIDSFLLRFETAEANLKCSLVEVPQLIYAVDTFSRWSNN